MNEQTAFLEAEAIPDLTPQEKQNQEAGRLHRIISDVTFYEILNAFEGDIDAEFDSTEERRRILDHHIARICANSEDDGDVPISYGEWADLVQANAEGLFGVYGGDLSLLKHPGDGLESCCAVDYYAI